MTTSSQDPFQPYHGKPHPVVPEPSFYGAAMTVTVLLLVLWRRARG